MYVEAAILGRVLRRQVIAARCPCERSRKRSLLRVHEIKNRSKLQPFFKFRAARLWRGEVLRLRHRSYEEAI